jgi:hypothetical protein
MWPRACKRPSYSCAGHPQTKLYGSRSGDMVHLKGKRGKSLGTLSGNHIALGPPRTKLPRVYTHRDIVRPGQGKQLQLLKGEVQEVDHPCTPSNKQISTPGLVAMGVGEGSLHDIITRQD